MNEVTAPAFHRYVALGDSTTEGLDDPYVPGGNHYRGWADRLAVRLASLTPDFTYANLAVRGRKIGQIHDTQLQPALAMKPDLASVVGGVNDLLRRRVDIEFVGDTMRAMQSALIAGGATVLSMTLPDLTASMRVARVVRERVFAYNETMRAVAAETGAVLVDLAADPGSEHPRFWSIDRLHASAEGHQRIADAAASSLGLPGAHWPDNSQLEPEVTLGLVHSIPADAAWFWAHLRPWLARRFKGTSSGDGIDPKRPEPAPVEIDG